jgi:hypothetical protein
VCCTVWGCKLPQHYSTPTQPSHGFRGSPWTIKYKHIARPFWGAPGPPGNRGIGGGTHDECHRRIFFEMFIFCNVEDASFDVLYDFWSQPTQNWVAHLFDVNVQTPIFWIDRPSSAISGPARSKKVEKGGPYGKNALIRGGKKVARRDHRWAPDRSGSG